MSGLLGALTLLATAALGPWLEVSAEPRELTIGDRARVTLAVRLPAGLPDGSVSWPLFESPLGDAEILDVGPVEVTTLADGERELRRTLTIAVFEVGEAVLPPLAVEVATASGPTVLAGEEIRLTVRSVLPQGDEPPELRPPAPPRSLEIGERFWWTSGALLATCLAALVLLAHQSKGAADGRGRRPAMSPRQELDRSLAALRAEGDTAALHQGLSMTARRYLGRVLEFPAPESTTSEVGRELRRRRVDADAARHAERLLAACDRVMFARHQAPLEQGRERIEEVVSIADAVEGWLRPGAAPDAMDRPMPEPSPPAGRSPARRGASHPPQDPPGAVP